MEPSITCPVCHRTSYNRYDIIYKYCGYCHDYHKEGGDNFNVPEPKKPTKNKTVSHIPVEPVRTAPYGVPVCLHGYLPGDETGPLSPGRTFTFTKCWPPGSVLSAQRGSPSVGGKL